MTQKLSEPLNKKNGERKSLAKNMLNKPYIT